jgi:hypothetical protein
MKISRRAIVRYYSHQAIQTLFQVFEKRFGMKQRKPKLKRNSPGRPRLRYKGLAIVMRLPPDELKALDRWIKADGALLSRQQAIRRILSIALGKSTSKASSAPGWGIPIVEIIWLQLTLLPPGSTNKMTDANYGVVALAIRDQGAGRVKWNPIGAA